eukprot:3201149-Prymnesium_polylepis.1
MSTAPSCSSSLFEIAAEALPRTDLAVPIRNRRQERRRPAWPSTHARAAAPPRACAAPPLSRARSQLVYSWNEELPTHIHEPDSPLFPLVALAKADAEGAGKPTSIA